MRTISRSITVLALLIAATGCVRQSDTEFVLPEGDVEQGRELFVSYGCNGCHTIPNADLPEPDAEMPVNIVIGGRVSRVRTYPELVTSIINPSHRLAKGYPAEEIETDGQSKMINYKHAMTVNQLIDLVAFLQAHYKLREYQPTDYPMYY